MKPEFIKPKSRQILHSVLATLSACLVYGVIVFALYSVLGLILPANLILLLAAHLPAFAVLAFFLYRIDLKLYRGLQPEFSAEQSLTGIYRLRFILRSIISLLAAALGYFVLVQLMKLPVLTAVLLIALALFTGNILLTILSYELLLYIVFGVLTSVVSIGSFSLFHALFSLLFGADYLGGLGWVIPQTISFVAAVLFGFITNRKYVFVSQGDAKKELLSFFGSRIITTLVFEYGGIFVLSNLLKMNEDIAKILASFFVVAVNYFISKFMIFKRDEKR